MQALDNVHVIRWIEPASGDEALRSYTQRLASTIQTEHPFDIGGSSFGGIVALELARHLQPERGILIGSCRSATELPAYYKPLERASRMLPDRFLRPPAAISLFIAHQFGITKRDHRKLFFEMLNDTPVSFLRWATSTILGWKGSRDLRIPIFHIHGGNDHLIPLKYVRPDRVVAGAGHLLNLTHPSEVNGFVEEVRSR